MLLGLTMGLVVAGYVYVGDVRPPGPDTAAQTAASAPAADAETRAAKPEPRPQAAAPAATPAAARTPPAAREPAAEASAAQTSTAKSSTAQVSAAQAQAAQTAAAETTAQQPSSQRSVTRFQFFENLPQSEVVVAEPSTAPSAARAPSATAAAASTAARAAATAATTATAAIEEPGSYMLQVGSFRTHADADRRKASIALLGYESHIQQATVNGDLVHRVLVGPITDPQALDDARRRFRAQNFDTLVLKAAK